MDLLRDGADLQAWARWLAEESHRDYARTGDRRSFGRAHAFERIAEATINPEAHDWLSRHRGNGIAHRPECHLHGTGERHALYAPCNPTGGQS
jgi:hypothetical protein